MSLQLAAQHLSDHGRGPDDTLVHMSRDEVKSLNDLAMAHGGQLTTNPQTGLPEAGFLSSILPMVAGAALTGLSGGAINPMTAGFLVGGGSMLLNPKAGLMGGLMAGLGAYGGAGLGAGLENLATSEAGLTSGQAANTAADEAIKKQIAEREVLMQQQAAQNASTPFTNAAQVEQATANAIKPFSPEQIAQNRVNFINEFQATAPPPPTGMDAMYQGAKSIVTDPTADKFKALGGGSWTGLAKTAAMAAAPAAPGLMKQGDVNAPTSATAGKQVVPHYGFTPGMVTPTPQASATGKENTYFTPQYRALSDAEAKQMYPGYAPAVLPAADGGLMGYAGGGPVEAMSNANAIGANTGFPQAYLHNAAYATPYQTPISQNVLTGPGDVSVDPYTGEQKMATGGISDAGYNLGGYSDGGRLLRGPGDGVSDSIPASIGHKQPARLADGEFVVPARIVSELGNGSTEAGARRLYAMMDRVQSARKKTIGKDKVAHNTRADKYLPA